MKQAKDKRGVFVMGVAIALFLLSNVLSLVLINEQRDNMQVVHYVGIVQSSTQKLVKEEMAGRPDDELITRLDTILTELQTGEGPYGLTIPAAADYLDYINRMQTGWGVIKNEIQRVRNGENSDQLYKLSQDYYTLADEAANAAVRYYGAQVRRGNTLIWTANIIFIGFLVFAFISIQRISSNKEQTAELDKLAYSDTLTGLANRVSCERFIDALTAQPPESDIGVVMFDMNNLNAVNEQIGHRGGDRLIIDFADILRANASADGFVSRYGGDEFLCLFTGADESSLQQYLTVVNEKVISYNLQHINDIERLSFAVGYYIGNMRDTGINQMISEADRNMYTRKREMKGSGPSQGD